MCAVLGCSVEFDSLWPHGLQPTRLLCPWGFPGKNTGVSSLSLLQGIFPTEGSNPGIPAEPQGKPLPLSSPSLNRSIHTSVWPPPRREAEPPDCRDIRTGFLGNLGSLQESLHSQEPPSAEWGILAVAGISESVPNSPASEVLPALQAESGLEAVTPNPGSPRARGKPTWTLAPVSGQAGLRKASLQGSWGLLVPKDSSSRNCATMISWLLSVYTAWHPVISSSPRLQVQLLNTIPNINNSSKHLISTLQDHSTLHA